MADFGSETTVVRKHYDIGGIVQGVGFRPFVYRQAHENRLTGWVRNTPAGVQIEVQGETGSIQAFNLALTEKAPPLSVITSCISREIPSTDDRIFVILPSSSGSADIQIAPDSALCADCLHELFDPADRRYRYPFITCTNCGPRYSIITGIPYDRPNTTMAGFPLCPDCLKEYHDPADRRFHAQPVACPVCGPVMKLLDVTGRVLASGDDAISLATERLSSGGILAVKGIGGYHLAVDACNNDAVGLLRERKKRDEKPFAVMAADMSAAREFSVMGEMEERLLNSPETPIVIARKRPDSPLSPLVAPGNDWIGLMLPYAPQHHLLFARQNRADSLPCPLLLAPPFQALVMTSGNSSDEPIAFRDGEAMLRLSGIADCLLVHDRPIRTREDDSVIRVFQERPLFYRRGRGYAPRAISIPFDSQPVLAVGAELKNTICLLRGSHAFMSPHIGDLKNEYTCDSFRDTIDHLSGLLEIVPTEVACDMHPDYLSTRAAEKLAASMSKEPVRIQHHHAHLASCMAENSLDGDVIGIIFDGTGYGSDGTIWGGEFLVGGYEKFCRPAHFRPVRLPGGDAAVLSPWRMALSCLYQSIGENAFTINHQVAGNLAETDREIFRVMLDKGINAPFTTSCGRLFDAAAALLNIRHIVTYDGQAAMELEAAAETAGDDDLLYPFAVVNNDGTLLLDFAPVFPAIMADIDCGTSTAAVARRFHRTVAHGAIEICTMVAGRSGCDRAVLSGGVFQNRLLTEMMYTGLTKAGLQVFTHRLAPPNDGGIALGQAAIAGWKTRRIS